MREAQNRFQEALMVLFYLVFLPILIAQQADTPRPIAALDSVWIEELTWMEVRDAIKAGKTTVIIPAGSTEQNGPYVPTAKHAYVLRATCDAIARKLGNALVAPIIPYEPKGRGAVTAGTISVRQDIYEGLVADVAASLKQGGFKNIILIGDSGGNQRGLDAVSKKLSAEWNDGSANIYYIKDYYDSWVTVDKFVEDSGLKPVPEGIHDDYSVNSILMTVGPEKIRFDQRVAANKASINGISITPKEKTLEMGRKLVEIRANATVEAIRKMLK
jgi:creatinine amidohydrolase